LTPTLTDRAYTVLIVDDDVVMRILAQRTIQKVAPGARVLTAPDGIEGLAHVEEHRPDLVLIDHDMPRKTGAELISDITGMHGYDPRIIYWSGRSEEKLREQLTVSPDGITLLSKTSTGLGVDLGNMVGSHYQNHSS
jgi:CheY-like chemotaxis protein